MANIPQYLLKQEGYGFDTKIYLLAPEKWKTGIQLATQSHEVIHGLPMTQYEYVSPNQINHETTDRNILNTVQKPEPKVLALMVRMLNRSYARESTEWNAKESTGAYFGYFLFDEIATMYQYIKSLTPGDYFENDEQRWYAFNHPSDLLLKQLRDVNIIISNFYHLANGWYELCMLCGYNYQQGYNMSDEVFRLAKQLKKIDNSDELIHAYRDAIIATRVLPLEYPSPTTAQLKKIYEIGSKQQSPEVVNTGIVYSGMLAELQRDACGICELYARLYPKDPYNRIWAYLLFKQLLVDLTDYFSIADIIEGDIKKVGWDNKGHAYIDKIPYTIDDKYMTSDRCFDIVKLNPIVMQEYEIMRYFLSSKDGYVDRDIVAIISRIISTSVPKGALQLSDYVARSKTKNDLPLYQDLINRELSVFHFYCRALRDRSDNFTKDYNDWAWDQYGHSPNEAKQIYDNAKTISETHAPWLLTEKEFEIYMNTVAPKPNKREKAIFEHLNDYEWKLLNIQSDLYYDRWRKSITKNKRSLEKYPIGMPMDIMLDGKKTSAVNFYPNTGLWNYDTADDIQKRNASFWSKAADFLRNPWEKLTGETFIDFVKNTLLKVINAIIEIIEKTLEGLDPLLPTIIKFGVLIAIGFIGYSYVKKKVVG